MRKVCIVATAIIVILLTIPTILDIYVSPIDIISFVFLTYIFDRICFCIGKYIELRRERQKFELIIQKIEENLKCQKNIQ